MKKIVILYATLLGMFAFIACQPKQAYDTVAENSELVDVTFDIALPEEELQMRAALFGEASNSALGAFPNIDLANQYDLRYQMAIYRVDAGGSMPQVVAPIKQIKDTNTSAFLSVRLTPNRRYKVVVWADFVRQGQDTDLHYNTSTFPVISYIDPTGVAILNDESRDAFFGAKEFAVGTTSAPQSLTLTRPFAKLRIVATDWNVTTTPVDQVKISYYGCKRFTEMNLLSNTSTAVDLPNTASNTVYSGVLNKTQKEYALGYDLTESNRTVFVDYLMTNPTGQTPIHLIFEALDGSTSLVRYNLKTNIPIQRNWLTTVLGNVLTNTTGTVTISSAPVAGVALSHEQRDR